MSEPWKKYQQGNVAPWEKYGGNATISPQDTPQIHGAQLAGAVHGFNQGATLGLADHVEAGLSSLIPSNFMAGGADVKFGDYKGNLEKIRERDELIEQAAPKTALAAEIGGNIAGLGKAYKAGATFTKALPQGLTKAQKLAATTAALGADGAVIGGLDAAINDKDVGKGVKTGAALGAGGNVLLSSFGKILSPLFKRAPKKKPPPTLDELKQVKNEAYKQVDDAGAAYSPEQVQQLFAGIADEIPMQGLGSVTSRTHPTTTAAMRQIGKAGDETVTLSELDKLRQLAGSAQPTNPKDGFFAGKISKNIDEFTEAMTPSQGSADAGEKILAARSANNTFKNSQLLDDALYGKDLSRAASGSGGNTVNSQRQAIAAILKSPKKRRGFNAEQIAEMESFVKGTTTQNAARLVGKLSPEGNGLMAALGIGGAVVNPKLAALSGAGFASKRLSEKLSQQQLDKLVGLVRTGQSNPRLETAISRAMESDEGMAQLARLLSANAPTPHISERAPRLAQH